MPSNGALPLVADAYIDAPRSPRWATVTGRKSSKRYSVRSSVRRSHARPVAWLQGARLCAWCRLCRRSRKTIFVPV